MKKYIKVLFKINRVKLTAVFVINCFLFSFVYGNVMAEVSAAILAGGNNARILNDLLLPYSYGKITQTNITDSPRIVIQIQDLHCHPQVQKNISNIIELVDKKLNNGLKAVYLEGAFGSVDTSWLINSEERAATSENNENTLLDKMLSTGRLTGAEYYSALTRQYDIIKGLESKDEYLDNVKRFGGILERQGEVLEILAGIEESARGLKERYYNRKQIKIENLFESYSKQEISTNKYYALLLKHSDRLGVDISKYENISLYTLMLQEGKQLKYEQVSKELQNYIYILKEKLPYGSYKAILDATDNFALTDKLYEYLIILSKEFNIDVSSKFPELDKFFDYVETGHKLNPIELVNEEQRLRNEINSRFSDTKTQREVVFLIDFEKYLKDYLTTKITSGDYAYYKENIEKYRKLWVKHVDNSVLNLLDEHISEADRFYAINVDRNKYFMRQLHISDSEIKDMPLKRVDAVTGEQKAVVSNSSLSALISDSGNKQVDIVITGGFHTEGVSKMLKENNISYIVITPNVTESIHGAEELYHKTAQLQSARLQTADRELPNENSKELLPVVADRDGGYSVRKSALANMIATLSPAEQAELFKEIGVSPERINELYGDIKLPEPVISDTARKALEIIKLVKAAKLLESDDNEEIIDGVIKTIKENLPENSVYKDKITQELIDNLDLDKVKEALDGNIKSLESALKMAEMRRDNLNPMMRQLVLSADNFKSYREALRIFKKNDKGSLTESRPAAAHDMDSESLADKKLSKAHGILSKYVRKIWIYILTFIISFPLGYWGSNIYYTSTDISEPTAVEQVYLSELQKLELAGVPNDLAARIIHDMIEVDYEKIKDEMIIYGNEIFNKYLQEFIKEDPDHEFFDDIIIKYELAVNIRRTIENNFGDFGNESIGEAVRDWAEQYKKYKNVSFVDENTHILTISNNEKWHDGENRFGGDSLVATLKIANVNIADANIIDIRFNGSNKQKMIDAMSNVKPGEKWLFHFDGHGGAEDYDFYLGEEQRIHYTEIAEVLKNLTKKGVSLDDITLYIASCYSVYGMKGIAYELAKNNLKPPKMFGVADEITIYGYSIASGGFDSSLVVMQNYYKKYVNSGSAVTWGDLIKMHSKSNARWRFFVPKDSFDHIQNSTVEQKIIDNEMTEADMQKFNKLFNDVIVSEFTAYPEMYAKELPKIKTIVLNSILFEKGNVFAENGDRRIKSFIHKAIKAANHMGYDLFMKPTPIFVNDIYMNGTGLTDELKKKSTPVLYIKGISDGNNIIIKNKNGEKFVISVFNLRNMLAGRTYASVIFDPDTKADDQIYLLNNFIDKIKNSSTPGPSFIFTAIAPGFIDQAKKTGSSVQEALFSSLNLDAEIDDITLGKSEQDRIKRLLRQEYNSLLLENDKVLKLIDKTINYQTFEAVILSYIQASSWYSPEIDENALRNFLEVEVLKYNKISTIYSIHGGTLSGIRVGKKNGFESEAIYIKLNFDKGKIKAYYQDAVVESVDDLIALLDKGVIDRFIFDMDLKDEAGIYRDYIKSIYKHFENQKWPKEIIFTAGLGDKITFDKTLSSTDFLEILSYGTIALNAKMEFGSYNAPELINYNNLWINLKGFMKSAFTAGGISGLVLLLLGSFVSPYGIAAAVAGLAIPFVPAITYLTSKTIAIISNKFRAAFNFRAPPYESEIRFGKNLKIVYDAALSNGHYFLADVQNNQIKSNKQIFDIYNALPLPNAVKKFLLIIAGVLSHEIKHLYGKSEIFAYVFQFGMPLAGAVSAFLVSAVFGMNPFLLMIIAAAIFVLGDYFVSLMKMRENLKNTEREEGANKGKADLPDDINKTGVKTAKVILAAAIFLNILLVAVVVILTPATIFGSVFFFIFSMYPLHFLISNAWALISKETRDTISGKIKKNTDNFANIMREYEITDDSPSATIQVPVYTEDNETIFETLRQSLAAVANYKSKADVQANLLVSDDGLQVWLNDTLSKESIDGLLAKNINELTEKEKLAVERIRFYKENNISFVARPKGNRSGRFKKGSNLNNTLNLAQRITSGELLENLTAPEGDFSGTYAQGDIVVNDIILLLDKDSGLNPEIISATVGEFVLDPKLAYTQHQTVPENNEESYFSRITGYFTNVLNSIAMPTNALQGQMISFVGHNGFLRKSFLQESSYPLNEGGSYRVYWAEDRVSEDYAKAMDAYALGYHGKYIAYEGLYFTEQVSKTFLEEAGKYLRYSYGIFEILFNDVKSMKKGLFNDNFKKYVDAQIKNKRFFDVVNLFVYMFSYLSLALILPASVISMFLLYVNGFSIVVPLISFIFTTLQTINVLAVNQKTKANPTLKIKDFLVGIAGIGVIFIGLSYSIIKGFLKFFSDSLSKKPKGFSATNVDSMDYGNFKEGVSSLLSYYKSNPLYAAATIILIAGSIIVPLTMPVTLLHLGLFLSAWITPLSIWLFTPQLVLPIINKIKRAFKSVMVEPSSEPELSGTVKSAEDENVETGFEGSTVKTQTGSAVMYAVRAANPGTAVAVTQKIAVEIVSSNTNMKNFWQKDLAIENNLVVVNDIGQAQMLHNQGFNAGTASVASQRPKAGDGWRKVKTTISKDGAKISVYVKNENGVRRIAFYSKTRQVDLESAKGQLIELFSDGIIDKTFKNVRQIIAADDISAGSVIEMMKNNHTYTIEENVNERVYDMSDKEIFDNFATVCRQEFRSNYVGIFVLSQSQALENKASVEKLRKEGMRFEVKIKSQNFDMNLLEGLDGYEIDAAEIETAAEAENLLQQIQKARLSVKDGIYSRISVRFSEDVINELDGSVDIWKKYSILPIVGHDSGYRSYAQISFTKDADPAKVAEALRKENTAAVSVEDTRIFAEIKEVIIETKRSVSFKQRYKKGYAASLNSKFDYTADNIKALEELLTADLIDNDKAKTAIGNMSETGLSSDSKSYLHYLADKGQYVEAVGFIRGIAANSMRKEIFQTLEKYNISLDMEKFQKDDKFRRAFLTLALQLKLAGRDIKELLRDDALSSVDPDMKAAEYFNLLVTRINKAIEDISAENEYSLKILTDEKAVVAVDMFKDFNALLQDRFAIREMAKQLKLPTTLAVRSILSAA